MKIGRLLWKAPQSASDVVRHADSLASICDREFFLLTKRDNVMPSRSPNPVQTPVVCIGRDSSGYWTLESNDENLPDETLDELRGLLLKWKGTRMFA